MKVIIPPFVVATVIVEPDKDSSDVKTFHPISISWEFLEHAPEKVGALLHEYAMRGHRKLNDKEVSDAD